VGPTVSRKEVKTMRYTISRRNDLRLHEKFKGLSRILTNQGFPDDVWTVDDTDDTDDGMHLNVYCPYEKDAQVLADLLNGYSQMVGGQTPEVDW
jgi:hypothetical protein